MAVLPRVATDGLINGWKNSNKLAQTAWRGQGPTMPNNPNTLAWMDVYEAPDGFGWIAYFVATDTGQDWIRSVRSHEDAALVETAWVTYVTG